jgi:ribosomal protein L7/L12
MIKFEGTTEEFAAMITRLAMPQVDLAYNQGKRDIQKSSDHMESAPTAKLAALRELVEACTRSEKIRAIKAVRELTGMGLKEAKDFVEEHGRATMAR